LTAEEAFDLACHEPSVQTEVLPNDFSYDFEKFEDFEATLEFRLKLSLDEIKERRKAKKEDREVDKRAKFEQKITLRNSIILSLTSAAFFTCTVISVSVMRMFERLHQTNDHAKNTRRARCMISYGAGVEESESSSTQPYDLI
jgi:hypothetical protein